MVTVACAWGCGADASGGAACDMTMFPECPACEDDTTCDAPTYADNGDGTVASSCCGLMWQQVVDAGRYDWPGAQAYCQSLSLAGGGWRLPTRAELESLFKPSGAIDPVAFPEAPTETFWTSTRYCCQVDSVWIVDSHGRSGNQFEETSHVRVRCVR